MIRIALPLPSVEILTVTLRAASLTFPSASSPASCCCPPEPDHSASETRQPAAKLATIQGARPLADALRMLADQTGEAVADHMGEPDPVVDVDLRDVPFWDALDALADKAGGRVDLHARDGFAVAPRPAGWHPPPVSRSGLFRTSLGTITAKLDLETDARTCTASVEVAWPPHALPIVLETRPHNLRVLDDAGRALPVGSPSSSLAPVDGRNSLTFDVSLPPVGRDVKSLSSVEGEFYAVAPTKMLTFSLGPLDAAPGDSRLAAKQVGVECEVSKVTAEDDHWSVEITLRYPEGNVKLDSYQSWVVNNEIYLEDKNGDRFPSSTYLLEESSSDHAVLTYHFSDKDRIKRGLGDWKVVYRTPALVVKVPVPFRFQNVRLP